MKHFAPWWAELGLVLLVLAGGVEALHFQNTVFSAADLLIMTAEIRSTAQTSGHGYAWLSNTTADNLGIAKPTTDSIDRSMLSFAPTNRNGVQNGAFTITVNGLSQDGCRAIASTDLMDDLIVNGKTFLASGRPQHEAFEQCHSTFWRWSDKNTVVLMGA